MPTGSTRFFITNKTIIKTKQKKKEITITKNINVVPIRAQTQTNPVSL